MEMDSASAAGARLGIGLFVVMETVNETVNKSMSGLSVDPFVVAVISNMSASFLVVTLSVNVTVAGGFSVFPGRLC